MLDRMNHPGLGQDELVNALRDSGKVVAFQNDVITCLDFEILYTDFMRGGDVL